MAWIEDEKPCNYFGEDFCDVLRAVGWLSKENPYIKGELRPWYFPAFKRIARSPQAFMIDFNYFGSHRCEFCNKVAGGDNIFIPDLSEKTIWAAPKMILHYIKEHEYLPPVKFLAAAASATIIPSRAYYEQLRELGNKDFNKAIDRQLELYKVLADSNHK